MAQTFETVNCACVIHGDAYSWTYVERLYNMLCRNITLPVIMHVYTEENRPVPAPFVKHALLDWGIGGPKLAWWYKMQLFDPSTYSGPLLYFDLDTVIVDNIDWILQQPLTYFWAVHDFKHLWRPHHQGMNSSVMWWDTAKFDYVWSNFKNQNLQAITKKYHGDQDYITQAVNVNQLRFFENKRVKSWRWQCKDGGYNFKKRVYKQPGVGTLLEKDTSVLVFHGKPKPSDLQDSVILHHWR